jgi:hypothetical protein
MIFFGFVLTRANDDYDSADYKGDTGGVDMAFWRSNS